MPKKTWKWFYVTDLKRIAEDIQKITTTKLKLTIEERKRILQVLGVHDHMIYSRDYASRIEKAWEEMEKNPDDLKTARKVRQTLEEVYEQVSDEELKLICQHGIALTSETYSDCLERLLSIYHGAKEYEGYMGHTLLKDIFTEHRKSEEKNPKICGELHKIFHELKESGRTEDIRNLFLTLEYAIEDLSLLKDMSEYLLERKSDDCEVLDRMVDSFYATTLDDKAFENKIISAIKILLLKNFKAEKHLQWIIEGELSFPEEELAEIIERLRQDRALPSPKLDTKLAYFKWGQLDTRWDELSTDEIKERWDQIDKLFVNAAENNMSVKEYLRNVIDWYYQWSEVHTEFIKKAEKYAVEILKQEGLEEGDFSFLIDVGKKLGTVKNDISFLEKVIEKALRKHPESLIINSKIGQFYEERDQKDRAIKRFECGLKNKKFTSIWTILKMRSKRVFKGVDPSSRYAPKLTHKKIEEAIKKIEYVAFGGEGEISFQHLLNLYLERRKYDKVLGWCRWLESKSHKIQDVEKYIAEPCCKVGEELIISTNIFCQKRRRKHLKKNLHSKHSKILHYLQI